MANKMFQCSLSVRLTEQYVDGEGRQQGYTDDRMELTEQFEIGPAEFLELMGILGRVQELANTFRAEMAAKRK